MKKYIIGILVSTGLIVFHGCSSGNDAKAEFPGESVAVTLSSPEGGEGEATTAGTGVSGRLVSKNKVNVSTRVMGYITSISANVGQNVKAGAPLVSISSSELAAQSGRADAMIAQAQANYNSAKKDYERFQNLFASESATQKELDDMTARFEAAKAGLEMAKQGKNEVSAHYGYTNITAPISGTVTAKYAEPGDLANPGMPILTIESSSSLQAEVMVSEQNITKVKQGMPVEITVKSTGQTVEGEVAEISRSASQTGGQYLVKINLPSNAELLPGMFVNAKLPFSEIGIQENKEGISVPESALVKKGQMTGVYVVSSQGTAVLRWVRTGRKSGENVEILSGLAPDERYIVSADGRLYNGVKVNVKK